MVRTTLAQLRTRSGDGTLLNRLSRPWGPGSVHSVFARAVNVELPDGFLISLVTADGDDAPRTLAVETADWTALPVIAGQSVVLGPGGVRVQTPGGVIHISTTSAQKWHPISPVVAPALAARGPGALAGAAAALEEPMLRYGARGGMLGPAADAGPMDLAVAEALRSGRERLLDALRGSEGGRKLTGGGDRPWAPANTHAAAVSALAEADAHGSTAAPTPETQMPEAQAPELQASEAQAPETQTPETAVSHAVLALLGLGPGLTPAGDDFLSGLALLAALPGSALAGFAPILRGVLAAHAGRTTAVSAATLAEAADGRARAAVLDLLGLVAAGGPPRDLAAAVRRVLAAGHTSGADTLSGLVAGLRLEEELRGQL